MKKLVKLSLGLTGFAIASGSGLAAAQTANDLVGTWSLISITYEQNGKATQPYGANPKGIQVFGSDGRVVVVIVKPDLPKFASNSRVEGTTEENKAVVQGSLAYFGTYKADDKSYSLQIDGSTFPNFTGSSQKRAFVIKGDELTVSNTAASAGLPSTTVWRRVK